MCGIEPVWASEIEPYPIKATTARFPNMKHLGSILDIDGAKVEPVDIICGGSPCQDLSVAGKQKGLHEGERSHLFFEMTRIIKEMRNATNGKQPRYVIWENVPGAFSSNKGYDFLAVLQAFAEIADPDIHVPEPKQKAPGKGLAWKYAGYVAGDGWSIAWRTVDAQYWGVPQRRRRIYLVAGLGGERADEILFERTGVSGDFEPCGTQGQEASEDAGRCTQRSDKFTPPKNSAGFVGRQGAKSGSVGFEHDISPTLRQGITADVVYEKAHLMDAYQHHGYREGETCGTLTAGQNNTVRGDTPLCVFDITGTNSNSMKSPTPDSCFRQRDVGRTLDTFVGSPECNQGGMVVVRSVDCRNMALNDELGGTLQAKSNGGQSLNYQNPIVYSKGEQ